MAPHGPRSFARAESIQDSINLPAPPARLRRTPPVKAKQTARTFKLSAGDIQAVCQSVRNVRDDIKTGRVFHCRSVRYLISAPRRKKAESDRDHVDLPDRLDQCLFDCWNCAPEKALSGDVRQSELTPWCRLDGKTKSVCRKAESFRIPFAKQQLLFLGIVNSLTGIPETESFVILFNDFCCF